jgi:hypothetical protein
VRKAYQEVPPKLELFHHAIWKVAGYIASSALRLGKQEQEAVQSQHSCSKPPQSGGTAE